MGNMNPEVSQPIFSNALNLFPTVVKIVETMVWSKATRNNDIIQDEMVKNNGNPVRYCS